MAKQKAVAAALAAPSESDRESGAALPPGADRQVTFYLSGELIGRLDAYGLLLARDSGFRASRTDALRSLITKFCPKGGT